MKRLPKKMPLPLERRLSGYALTASAAAVGMLALAQPTEAKIVYSRTPEVLHRNKPFYLDLNHDGTYDFRLAYSFYSGWIVRVAPFNDGSPNAMWGSGHYASALPEGVRIQKSKYFGYSHSWMASCSPNKCFGQWYNVNARYLGLEFVINGEIHYGWARLSIDGSRKPLGVTAILTGYAYETIRNKPIITGKTKGRDVIILQPGSLGHLARGTSAK